MLFQHFFIPQTDETEDAVEQKQMKHSPRQLRTTLKKHCNISHSVKVKCCSLWSSLIKPNACHAGLRLMPSSALLDILCRMEAVIIEYSEELVAQLARRDELEFEKEVKNTFITALMEVQNRQKEQRELSKRRRKDKAMSLQGSTRSEKTGSMPAKVRVLKWTAWCLTPQTSLSAVNGSLLLFSCT